MKKPFTKEEEKIMSLIVEAHILFTELEPIHNDDIREWVDGVHKCQNVLKGRVVARDYPNVFYSIKEGNVPRMKNPPSPPSKSNTV